MRINTTCPQCGAKMERESSPERYVCPYCDEVVYPERSVEERERPQPAPQPIYVPNEELIAQSVAKRLATEQAAKAEAEEDENEGSLNNGCTAFLWIIVVIGAIALIASF